jgi:hypothetical protein
MVLQLNNSGHETKSKDQVMSEEALGVATLDVLPTKPRPLMGPRGAMSILCWNYRGLRSSLTVQELCTLVKAKSPSMVFLMETRRSAQRAMNLK